MTASETKETSQTRPESMDAAISLFPLGILYVATSVCNIFLLIIVTSIADLPPAPADKVPFFSFTAFLTYIVARLSVAKDWGWKTAFALNWFKPRTDKPYHRLNDTISIPAYCAIMTGIFTLLMIMHPHEALLPKYSAAENDLLSLYMYRTMFAFVGAIFLPWLALRLYILIRFGSNALQKSQWAID